MNVKKIKILDPHTINSIAAGEVIERPASILKELLDNAIDAGSTEIKVNITEGGIDQIEVSDNGSGIAPEDIELALKNHATSKINNADDLKSINSFGFRGEALASISSVAEISIGSKTQKSSAVQINAMPKQRSIISETGRNSTGTTITVKNLFLNTPARRKFLKSKNTEQKYTVSTFKQIALANPSIKFSLLVDGKLQYILPETDKVEDRIYDIYKILPSNLSEVSYESELIQIEGFTSKPGNGFNSRTRQYLFINKRPIKDKALNKAIYNAYQSHLHKNLHPEFFISINIRPDLIDINAHPQKTEIRFSEPNLVFSSLLRAVSATLSSESKESFTNASFIEKPRQIENSIKPYQVKSNNQFISRESFNQYRPNNTQKTQQAINFTQSLLETVEYQDTKYSNTRFFQIFNTYICFEEENNFIIVDQHAAAEKVLYEKLVKEYKGKGIQTQRLLIAEEVELDMEIFEEIEGIKEELIQLGIEVKRSDKAGIVNILSKPALVTKINVEQIIIEIITGNSKIHPSIESNKDIHIGLATIACHSSIRGGQRLNELEMRNIMEDLMKLDNPGTCPHGRPTYTKKTKTELIKEFARDL